jgi:hypothetical protein
VSRLLTAALVALCVLKLVLGLYAVAVVCYALGHLTIMLLP